MQRLGQCFCVFLNLLYVVAFEAFAEGSDSVIDLLHLAGISFVAQFFDGLFSLVNQSFGIVLSFDAFFALLIFFFMGLSVVLHLLDFFIREAGGRGDVDLLFLAGAEVFCGNVNNAVGIDVEGDLDLRYAPWSRRDIGELEAAESLVVSSHGAFALEDMDVYGWLVIRSGGEYLGLGGRDGGISLDHGGEYAA